MTVFSNSNLQPYVQYPKLPSETDALLGILGRNTLWLWIDRGLLAIGTLVTGLLLVRYLGPGNYGLYSLAISLGALTASFLDLGLTRYAARTIAANPEDGPAILSTCFSMSMLLLVASALAFVVYAHRQNSPAECICAGLIIGNFQRLATIAAFFLTAELRSLSVLAGSFFSRLATIGVTMIVIVRHLSVLSLLIGLAFISLPLVGIRLWQLRHHCPSRRDWRWSGFRRIVRQAWPFMSYSWTETGYAQLSILCLGVVASRQEVGWFSAALVITGIFPQWTFASSDALLPIMTRLFEAGKLPPLLELREQLLDVFIIAAVPVAVTLSVFARFICALIGPRFASSAPVLQILAGCAMLSALGGLLGGAVLMAINKVKERRNALAMTLVSLAPLTLLLGWLWGPRGAGLALLIADTIVFFQYIRIFKAIGMPLRFGSTTWISLSAGAVMAGFSLSIEHITPWPVNLSLAWLLYFGAFSALARRQLTNAGRTLRQCIIGAEV